MVMNHVTAAEGRRFLALIAPQAEVYEARDSVSRGGVL